MSHRPVGAGASFNFSAGAASTSSAFSVQSNVVRIVAVSGAAHVKIDGDPVASRSDYYIPSGESVTLALTKASNRVVGVTTGSTTIIDFAEGTQSPFGVGDYVTLSGTTYHDFSHKRVSAVDTSSGVSGYQQERITVQNDSSGIITAFSSPDASLTLSQKISAFGVAAGTIYHQQVQITGQA